MGRSPVLWARIQLCWKVIAKPGTPVAMTGPAAQAPAAQVATAWCWPDCLVLLDSGAAEGELPGGTGLRLDVAVAAEVAAHRRIILAGGLGPDDAVPPSPPAEGLRPGQDGDGEGMTDKELIDGFLAQAGLRLEPEPP